MTVRNAAFNQDLHRAAYHAAAALVAAETFGGGGWSLIWKCEAPEPINERAGSFIYTYQPRELHGLICVAATMGEALSGSERIQFPELLEMADRRQITDPATGKRVARAILEDAAEAVLRHWGEIDNAARAHLEQWQDPDKLPLYRLDNIEGNDNPPEHHKPYLEPGTKTPASLFQSPFKAFAIPDKVRTASTERGTRNA